MLLPDEGKDCNGIDFILRKVWWDCHTTPHFKISSDGTAITCFACLVHFLQWGHVREFVIALIRSISIVVVTAWFVGLRWFFLTGVVLVIDECHISFTVLPWWCWMMTWYLWWPLRLAGIIFLPFLVLDTCSSCNHLGELWVRIAKEDFRCIEFTNLKTRS